MGVVYRLGGGPLLHLAVDDHPNLWKRRPSTRAAERSFLLVRTRAIDREIVEGVEAPPARGGYVSGA